ncbi:MULTISPECIES: glutathione S-transferase family protein [Phenylobacterium]|uniref:Glutathione S-transferase n=1 Tax=Phenylobacterium koreense TaxID=266125 RepID=A0ABV2EDM1_9CAUL
MLIFYHAPQSRSGTTLWLLEELGVPYQIELVDIRREGGAPESYRAIQPHKKAPAIVHEGVVITERAAIATYLADAFPEAGLAPPIGDPRRGPYLSWLVYVDSVLDPCLSAKAFGWQYDALTVSFGRFEDAVAHVEATLSAHDYAVGDAFTAADVSLATALHWAAHVAKLLPETPAVRGYLDRIQKRPGFQRFMAKAMEGA